MAFLCNKKLSVSFNGQQNDQVIDILDENDCSEYKKLSQRLQQHYSQCKTRQSFSQKLAEIKQFVFRSSIADEKSITLRAITVGVMFKREFLCINYDRISKLIHESKKLRTQQS